MSRPARWGDASTAPHRRRLLAVFAEADAALAEHRCPASADCCHFTRTGREPFVTRGEWEEIVRAVRAAGRKLPPPPADAERTCPMLGGDDRCTIYPARPLGCRTYFCDRRTGPGPMPRAQLARLVTPLREVAEALDPSDPGSRPLSSWLALARR